MFVKEAPVEKYAISWWSRDHFIDESATPLLNLKHGGDNRKKKMGPRPWKKQVTIFEALRPYEVLLFWCYVKGAPYLP